MRWWLHARCTMAERQEDFDAMDARLQELAAESRVLEAKEQALKDHEKRKLVESLGIPKSLAPDLAMYDQHHLELLRDMERLSTKYEGLVRNASRMVTARRKAKADKQEVLYGKQGAESRYPAGKSHRSSSHSRNTGKHARTQHRTIDRSPSQMKVQALATDNLQIDRVPTEDHDRGWTMGEYHYAGHDQRKQNRQQRRHRRPHQHHRNSDHDGDTARPLTSHPPGKADHGDRQSHQRTNHIISDHPRSNHGSRISKASSRKSAEGSQRWVVERQTVSHTHHLQSASDDDYAETTLLSHTSSWVDSGNEPLPQKHVKHRADQSTAEPAQDGKARPLGRSHRDDHSDKRPAEQAHDYHSQRHGSRDPDELVEDSSGPGVAESSSTTHHIDSSKHSGGKLAHKAGTHYKGSCHDIARVSPSASAKGHRSPSPRCSSSQHIQPQPKHIDDGCDATDSLHTAQQVNSSKDSRHQPTHKVRSSYKKSRSDRKPRASSPAHAHDRRNRSTQLSSKKHSRHEPEHMDHSYSTTASSNANTLPSKRHASRRLTSASQQSRTGSGSTFTDKRSAHRGGGHTPWERHHTNAPYGNYQAASERVHASCTDTTLTTEQPYMAESSKQASDSDPDAGPTPEVDGTSPWDDQIMYHLSRAKATMAKLNVIEAARVESLSTIADRGSVQGKSQSGRQFQMADGSSQVNSPATSRTGQSLPLATGQSLPSATERLPASLLIARPFVPSLGILTPSSTHASSPTKSPAVYAADSLSNSSATARELSLDDYLESILNQGATSRRDHPDHRATLAEDKLAHVTEHHTVPGDKRGRAVSQGTRNQANRHDASVCRDESDNTDDYDCIDDGDIAGMSLDPEKAMPVISDAYAAAISLQSSLGLGEPAGDNDDYDDGGDDYDDDDYNHDGGIPRTLSEGELFVPEHKEADEHLTASEISDSCYSVGFVGSSRMATPQQNASSMATSHHGHQPVSSSPENSTQEDTSRASSSQRQTFLLMQRTLMHGSQGQLTQLPRSTTHINTRAPSRPYDLAASLNMSTLSDLSFDLQSSLSHTSDESEENTP
eukprot:scpid9204/ scgid12291/ 